MKAGDRRQGKGMHNREARSFPGRFSMAMAPQPSNFAPLVFAGRLGEGIKALSENGFAAVEISLRRAQDIDAEWLARQLSEYGLEVSAFASGRVCLEDSLCLSDPHPKVRSEIRERLTSILELAGRFHAPLIIGGVRGKLEGDETQRAEQRACAIDTLRSCAAIAHDLGIHLLLEPINRYETNFINSAQDGLELIEGIGDLGVKLLLDTFHMNIEEVDPCSTIRTAGARLGYLHFADSNRLAPGQGHIDFPTLLQTLAEIGYGGFISAEILPFPDDATALAQTADYLRSLVGAGAIHSISNRR